MIGWSSKRTNEYLIKWSGYRHEHNTWESGSYILDALIKEYRENQAARAVRRANDSVGGARSTRRG